LVKEGTYDVVVGNPPYQGLSKTSQFEYVTKNYPRGKADLYAAFLERGLELCRPGGMSALLTMRGWMFLGQFKELREAILADYDLRAIGDFDRGAFDEVPNEVLAVAAPMIRRVRHQGERSVAIQPTPFDEVNYDRQRTNRKRAAVLAQVGRHEFDPKGFEVIEGEPIVYWWSKEFLARYAATPKVGQASPARFGLTTGDNGRFVRFWYETARFNADSDPRKQDWTPFVLGGKGRKWIEDLREVCRWTGAGFEVKLKSEVQYGTVSKQIRNEEAYFRQGIAFAMIGASFNARVHRYPSVIGNMGSSVYPAQIAPTLCLMNASLADFVLQSLNPGVHFEVGDVNRLPIFPVANADDIFATIEQAFTEHESHREPSVEFKKPGPSPWRYAQDWAQRAVDRPDGAPLPPYEPEYDPPDPEAERSFAVGIALGRFGANGEGILDPSTTTPSAPPPCLRGSVVRSGILFVSPSDPGELRDWLRKDFFTYHKSLYENRPIYFPLSSEKRSFVAWVSIHRWADDTLQVLLADHLHPALREIDGEIDDLNRSRSSSDKKTAAAAEKRYTTVKKLRDELAAFVDAVSVCAERGAPPTDPGCPPREVDATFHMDLDDGVMINSAALWPLLEPQWKDPKKWWKQLCEAKGKKDYDWSHLAHRYFPARVDAKCRQDPSLGVAHGCFWRYHPAKAYAWELRMKDEIRPDFTIDEEDSDECRARFLAEHADEAQAIWEKEMVRRERKKAKQREEDAPADGEVGEESETEGEE
jgi:hypothetical protein